MAYSRTRISNAPNEYGYYRKDFINNGVSSLYEEADFITKSDRKTISDYVTPNYRAVIASGGIVNNPCSFVREELNETPGSYLAIHSSQPWVYQASGPVVAQSIAAGNAGAFWAHTPVVDTTPLVEQAKQQCIADINSTPYSFAEDSLELASTVRYLKTPGKSLLRLLEETQRKAWKIKRQRGYKARRIAEELNDLYLQRQFVMKPLVQSASDIIDAYQDKKDYRAERYSARGFASTQASHSDNFDVDLGWGAYNTWHITTSNIVKVHAYSLYVHRDNRGVLHKLGMRGDDGFVALWNIVPLSFMVDRLYDISSFMKGVQALHDPQLGILSSGYVVRQKKIAKLTYKEQYNPGWEVNVSGAQERTAFSYTRVHWQPSYSDTVPVFRPHNLVRDARNIAELFSLSAGILNNSFKPGSQRTNAKRTITI